MDFRMVSVNGFAAPALSEISVQLAVRNVCVVKLIDLREVRHHTHKGFCSDIAPHSLQLLHGTNFELDNWVVTPMDVEQTVILVRALQFLCNDFSEMLFDNMVQVVRFVPGRVYCLAVPFLIRVWNTNGAR